MTYETVTQQGKRFALVPLGDLRRLIEEAEDRMDVRAADAVKRNARGKNAPLPLVLTKRVLLGEHPVAVYREYRGLSRAELGKAAGVSGQHIGMLEGGRRTGTVALLKKIATALRVEPDSLM